MSKRIDPTWTVVASIENGTHDRCVDLFLRPDGTYGFEEFRRDVEDGGTWTPVAFFSHAAWDTRDAALGAAARAVGWLAEALCRQRPT
ncbi:MAG: hypothetical protein ABSE20_28950 [Acetobacteraceae bacterium]|jgi:hypothetical protein